MKLLSTIDKRGTATLIEVGDSICDAYEALAGKENLSPNLQFQIHTGKNLKDFMFSGYVGFFVISDNFKSLLKTYKATGWIATKIDILTAKGKLIDGEFFLMQVTGKSDEIDYDKADVIVKSPLVPNGKPPKVRKGLYFNQSSWDGSDLFVPKDSACVIITDKLATELSKSPLTNIELCDLDSVETPVF